MCLLIFMRENRVLIKTIAQSCLLGDRLSRFINTTSQHDSQADGRTDGNAVSRSACMLRNAEAVSRNAAKQ